MNGSNVGTSDLRDEGLQTSSVPEEAVPGTPATNLGSYFLMVLLAVLMIVGAVTVVGSLPVTQNNQPAGEQQTLPH